MQPVQPEPKPRVLLGMPGGGHGSILALLSHCFLPGGKCQIVPAYAFGSAANYNHNLLFAQALKYYRDGLVDYLIIHHSDVEIRTQKWLDILYGEMKRTGAAMLAAVCSKKSERGDSNMAVSTDSPWAGRVLSLQETWDLPDTFSIADTQWPDRQLLVNTGLLLIDLSRPEWWQRVPSFGGEELRFCFRMMDRIAILEDGDLQPQFASEDWNFARTAADCGLPVFATTLIDIGHHGEIVFGNQEKPAEEIKTDFKTEETLSVEADLLCQGL